MMSFILSSIEYELTMMGSRSGSEAALAVLVAFLGGFVLAFALGAATTASKELSLLAKGFLTAAFLVAGAAASVAAMAVFVVAVLALVVLVVGTATGTGVLVRDDALVVVGAFPAIGNVVGLYGW